MRASSITFEFTPSGCDTKVQNLRIHCSKKIVKHHLGRPIQLKMDATHEIFDPACPPYKTLLVMDGVKVFIPSNEAKHLQLQASSADATSDFPSYHLVPSASGSGDAKLDGFVKYLIEGSRMFAENHQLPMLRLLLEVVDRRDGKGLAAFTPHTDFVASLVKNLMEDQGALSSVAPMKPRPEKEADLPEFWETNPSVHRHRLKNKGIGSNWRCDVCDDRHPTTARFRCANGCDWDMCAICLKKERDGRESSSTAPDADGDVNDQMVVPMLLQKLLDNGALKPVIMSTLTEAVARGSKKVQVGGNALLEMCRLTTLLLRKPIPQALKKSAAGASQNLAKHKGDWRLVSGKQSRVLEGPSASGNNIF